MGSFAERQMLLLWLVVSHGFPDQQQKFESRSWELLNCISFENSVKQIHFPGWEGSSRQWRCWGELASTGKLARVAVRFPWVVGAGLWQWCCLAFATLPESEALLEDYKTLLAWLWGEECHLLNPKHQSCANGKRVQLLRVLHNHFFNHAFLTLT